VPVPVPVVPPRPVSTVADEEPLRQQVRDFIAWLKKEKKP
jgi:hypothetical protein